MDLFNIEREKYWACPASYSREKRNETSRQLIESGRYLCSEKKDGNWCAFIKQGFQSKMQTRGRSRVTGNFGEVQDKVPHIFEPLNNYFENGTFIIGELYYEGGCDHDVGSILRCLPPKALQRQQKDGMLKFYIFDIWFCNGTSLMDYTFEDRVKQLEALQARFASNPYIEFAEYKEAKDCAYDLLAEVFVNGGEGIVMQNKYGKPEPDKRPARKSLKIKREIQQDIDVICTGIVPGIREYLGQEMATWKFWVDLKTGMKLYGEYYFEYLKGDHCVEPITKNYYYGWPGSIACSVYRDGKLVEVCNVSGLNEQLKEDLRVNPDKYLGRPLRVTGMQTTEDYSIRHPKFDGFRDDIDPKDCTFEKIFG